MNFRNRSFRGQNLRGASFRGADLRGADFSGADLRQADFSHALMGRGRGSSLLLLIAAWGVSVVLGVCSAWQGDLYQRLASSGVARFRVAGGLMAATWLLLFVLVLRSGVTRTFWRTVFIFLAMALMVGVLAVVSGAGTGVGAVAAGVTVVVTGAVLVLGALARVVAGTSGTAFFVVVAISGALAARLTGGGVAAALAAMAAAVVGRRALCGDARYSEIRRLALALACRDGTRFRSADLTDATFRGARLRNTDFRGAVLKRTDWAGARGRQGCRFI